MMAMRPFNRNIAGASLTGRVLLATIFIISGISKLMTFQSGVQTLMGKGLPIPQVLLAVAAAVEILGGLSILLGWKARWGALGLALYLVPVTIVFHGFWTLPGADFQLQLIQFLKNLAIMGGLVQVFAMGPGRYSVDESGWGRPRLDSRDTTFKLRRVS